MMVQPPYEEYSTMQHFSNLPKVDLTSALDDTQPFAVSFLNEDNDIIVDL